MTMKSIQLTENIYEYILAVSLREDPVLQRLREETTLMPTANMQISPEQGQFMSLLTRLLGVRKALEIGVFTGYSTLSVALALPDDGQIIACDISEEWTEVARRYWREARVEDKIDLRLAPALQTLELLIGQGHCGTFDLVFIDADKQTYASYFESSLRLLRTGGLIIVDNVLWSGQVVDTGNVDQDTVAIRRFNELLRDDERIHLSMLPIADGISLAMKR